jgi:protein-export membrane protein SecD
MRQTNLIRLAIIIILALLSIYLVLPTPKPNFVKNLVFWQEEKTRDLQIKQGLDLKGGLQVLLANDLPGGISPGAGQMETARRIIEQRVNGLGVAEPLVQLQGTDGNRILVELPGVSDRDVAINLIKQTGQLEFAEPLGGNVPLEGSAISTTFSTKRQLLYPQTTTGGSAITGTLDPGVLRTAFTGEIIQDSQAGLSQFGQYVVDFRTKPGFSDVFGEYTGSRIGQQMCIVLDKIVLSCPVIRDRLPGSGQISGNFNAESANNLSLQLNYGSLPVPLKLETTRDIGATLGAESVRRSIIAFAIALAALAIFMVAYYRLPGILSVLSLAFFTLTSLAVFILIPVTLTLPGIAGFVLSVATAVDANVLTFERFKEEIRSGRSLRGAVEAAFSRAWPSIRDSNLAALITCVVLFFFGGAFGASAVRGFAITLGLGILMSLFAAVFVTRTLMRLAFSQQDSDYVQTNAALLGV